MYIWILFSCKKEGNPAICDCMGELWRHYTKWNKPDRKTSIVSIIFGISNKLIETESGLMVARDGV